MKIVVVGGGFGGLLAVRGLRKADVDVTLVDRQNFFLFQPLVYQVATGALSSVEIALPLRQILKRQRNTRVVLGEVTGFELDAQQSSSRTCRTAPGRWSCRTTCWSSPAARATRTSGTTSGRRSRRS